VKKKRKIKAITAFKVIEVGTNRKPICDFLLVINSNSILSRTVSELSQLIVQISDNLRFRMKTYDVHLGLIQKRVVDFLLMLIELFSLGVTAESLRAKSDRKSAISLQRGHFDPKFI